MLVVVRLVYGVPMLPVEVVDVIEVADRFVATVRLVNVHVGTVWQVLRTHRLIAVRQLIDMIGAGPVHVAVVEEVHVVVVPDRGVPAPAIVLVIMAHDRSMRSLWLGARGG